MTEVDSVRLGWGEPIQLDGGTADLVRQVLVANPRSEEFSNALERLRAVFIPIVGSCLAIRNTIREIAETLDDLESFPQIGEPDYEINHAVIKQALLDASAAYKDRPPGCEMQLHGLLDRFTCDRCNFEERMPH